MIYMQHQIDLVSTRSMSEHTVIVFRELSQEHKVWRSLLCQIITNQVNKIFTLGVFFSPFLHSSHSLNRHSFLR